MSTFPEEKKTVWANMQIFWQFMIFIYTKYVNSFAASDESFLKTNYNNAYSKL